MHAPRGPRLWLFFLVAIFMPPAPAQAQGPGFLFGPPRVSVGAWVGYSFPRVGSDLFDFTREQFTLETGDFRSPYLGGALAVRLTERLDLAADMGWTRSRRSSEYRDWEDLDGLPIEQETTFERTTLTLGARYYLGTRGRSVGQFAWVPARVVPYVGVGAGAVWHEFSQAGDFVDFDTLDVFRDNIETSGVAPIVDTRFGADFSLSRRVVFTGEARYQFGSGATGGDYAGFADTDLAGFTVVFGVSFRM